MQRKILIILPMIGLQAVSTFFFKEYLIETQK
jgi:hypothetical protein